MRNNRRPVEMLKHFRHASDTIRSARTARPANCRPRVWIFFLYARTFGQPKKKKKKKNGSEKKIPAISERGKLEQQFRLAARRVTHTPHVPGNKSATRLWISIKALLVLRAKEGECSALECSMDLGLSLSLWLECIVKMNDYVYPLLNTRRRQVLISHSCPQLWHVLLIQIYWLARSVCPTRCVCVCVCVAVWVWLDVGVLL